MKLLRRLLGKRVGAGKEREKKGKKRKEKSRRERGKKDVFRDININTRFVGADLSALTKEAAVLTINRIFHAMEEKKLEEKKLEEAQLAGKTEDEKIDPMSIDATYDIYYNYYLFYICYLYLTHV